MNTTYYKSMDKDMKCRGFQYEIGKEYETDEIKMCERGFHACENPLDVLNYCDVCDNKFFEVEQSGDIKTDTDKTVSSKIKIKAELSLGGFIKAAVDFIFLKTKNKDSGNYSQLAASGDSSQLAASGNYSQLAASGDSSRLAASGDYSKVEVSGKESIACAIGIKSKARAKLGWIVIVDWQTNKGNWAIKQIYNAKVGQKIKGKKIQPDSWYWLEDGKLKTEKA